MAFCGICVVLGKARSIFSLSYSDNPSISFDKSRVSLFAGVSHVLNCHTLGIPSSAVKWLKNGQALKRGDFNGTISVVKSASEGRITLGLYFSSVEHGHSGSYTCEAQNKYNTRRRNLTVLISCMLLFFY